MRLVINWPGRAAETLDWPGNFTHGEMRLIKSITKLRPSEMADAIDADDPDIIISFASVALRRAHPELSDKEIGAELDALEFDGGIDVIADPVGQSPPAETREISEEERVYERRRLDERYEGDPRDRWSVTLSDLFGLQPWDVERLTPYELEAYIQYVQR